MTIESLMNNDARVTTRNISAVALLKVIQYPLLALFVLVVPRLMGPSDFGHYTVLISNVTIAGALIELAMTEIFGRFIPELELRGDWAGIARFTTQILSLKIILSSITAVGLFTFLSAWYGAQYGIGYYLLVTALLFVRDWQAAPFGLLFGLNQMARFTAQLPLRRMLSLTFILILYPRLGLIGAILSTVLAEGLIGLLGFYWARKQLQSQYIGVDVQFLRPYIRFGLIFSLAWLLVNVWQQLGNILVEALTKSAVQVALFSIANQIFLITSSTISFFIAALIPIFTQFFITDRADKIVRWSISITKYTGIICTLIYGAYLIAGSDLIAIIGHDYGDAFPNGVVLLAGMFPTIIIQVSYVLATIYQRPARYAQGLCLAILSFVAVSLLLVPQYASLGCAIATLISIVVLAFVMFLPFRAQLWPCLLELLKTIALGTICVPFLLFQGSVILKLALVLCFGLAYLLLIFATRLLNMRELAEIFSALRKHPGGTHTAAAGE